MIKRVQYQLTAAFKACLATPELPPTSPVGPDGSESSPKEVRYRYSGRSSAVLVFGALPAQLTAYAELPVEEILEAIDIAKSLPTRNGKRSLGSDVWSGEPLLTGAIPSHTSYPSEYSIHLHLVRILSGDV